MAPGSAYRECVYCGRLALRSRTCEACRDLPALDPLYVAERPAVTEAQLGVKAAERYLIAHARGPRRRL